MGKIPRLPKTVRARLNQLLEEGLPYAAILKQLGPHGKTLTQNNLSDWHHGGYQDWLQQREWLDTIHDRHELALNLLRENANGNIHEATLLVAATILSDILRNFNPAALNQTLSHDPAVFVRLLNALSRLSRQGIKCEHHREEVLQRKADHQRWQDTLKRSGILP